MFGNPFVAKDQKNLPQQVLDTKDLFHTNGTWILFHMER